MVVMGMRVAAETITKVQTTKMANLVATLWHRLRTSLALLGWFCEQTLLRVRFPK
jgi:hypothetical protein